jgi:hypothetical protein
MLDDELVILKNMRITGDLKLIYVYITCKGIVKLGTHTTSQIFKTFISKCHLAGTDN